MTASVVGRIEWSGTKDKDGHREYRLRQHVETTSANDGPETVFSASGSPVIGAPWNYGNDDDPWATCWPSATATPIITHEPNFHWILENIFSSKPLNRCQDTTIESPLAEPQKISGSFVKYTKEALYDRHGNLLMNSSYEMIRGIERDMNRAAVVIEQNVASLGLNVYTPMIDTLNDAPLWGLSERCIKLGNATFDRKLYGTCIYYYTRRFEFDIRFDTFDHHDVVDAGFKVFDSELYEDTVANRGDPRKYKVFKDGRGENAPVKILLDGNGNALGGGGGLIGSGTGTGPSSLAPLPVYHDPIEIYQESNFLLLNIPTSF